MFNHKIFAEEYNTPIEFIVSAAGKHFTLRICHADVLNAPMSEYLLDMADGNVKAACSILAFEYLQELTRNVMTDMAWRSEPQENDFNVPAAKQPEPQPVEEEEEDNDAPRGWRSWTAEENGKLMKMFYAGESYDTIAKELGRTEKAVGNRINIYQRSMNLPRRKQRTK